jgi:hypothetical protein
MASKKQSKADKDFIAKIATIGINTGGKKKDDHPTTCEGCGAEMEKIGKVVGLAGEDMGAVYGHPGMLPPPRRRRNKPEVAKPDEQSFSA